MNKGQTLIEAIIATLVVILLATGLISGTTAALKASQSARYRALGTKMAQEGIEIVRNKRDEGWNGFISHYVLTDAVPKTATENITITEGSLTFQFTRDITLTYTSGNQTTTVFVDVTWSEGSATRHAKAETILTNWR